MHDKKELCEKIKSIYPDIGECGIDVDVEYDGVWKENSAFPWVCRSGN